MKYNLILVGFLFFCSFKCNRDEKFIIDNIEKFSKNNITNNIQFDGIYKFALTAEQKKIYINGDLHFTNFITFFKNKFCTYSKFFAYTDSLEAIHLLKTKNLDEIKSGGGYFSINYNNEIQLIVRKSISISGGRNGLTFALFSGLVINKDSIINFRMIPPFPKRYNITDTIPRILVFHPFPAKLQLDSNSYYIKKYITP